MKLPQQLVLMSMQRPSEIWETGTQSNVRLARKIDWLDKNWRHHHRHQVTEDT